MKNIYLISVKLILLLFICNRTSVKINLLPFLEGYKLIALDDSVKTPFKDSSKKELNFESSPVSTFVSKYDEEKKINIAYNQILSYTPSFTGMLYFKDPETESSYVQLVSPCVPLLLYKNRATIEYDTLVIEDAPFFDFLLPNPKNDQNMTNRFKNQTPVSLQGLENIKNHFQTFEWTEEILGEYSRFGAFGSMNLYAEKISEDEDANKAENFDEITFDDQTLNLKAAQFLKMAEELNSIPFEEGDEKIYLNLLIEHLNNISKKVGDSLSKKLSGNNSYPQNKQSQLMTIIQDFQKKLNTEFDFWNESLKASGSDESRKLKKDLAKVFSKKSPEMKETLKKELNHMKTIFSQNMDPLPLLFYAAQYKARAYDSLDNFSGILGVFNQYISADEGVKEMFIETVNQVNSELMSKIFSQSNLIYERNEGILRIRDFVHSTLYELQENFNKLDGTFKFLNEDEFNIEKLIPDLINNYFKKTDDYINYEYEILFIIETTISEYCFDENQNLNEICKHFHRNFYIISPCLLYTSPSPRDLSTSRMPSSA